MGWSLDDDSTGSSVDEFNGAPTKTKPSGTPVPPTKRRDTHDSKLSGRVDLSENIAPESSHSLASDLDADGSPRPHKRRKIVPENKELGRSRQSSSSSKLVIDVISGGSEDDTSMLAPSSSKAIKQPAEDKQNGVKRSQNKRRGGGIVGRSTAKSGRGRPQKERNFDDESDDDALMEWTVPDYLKDRRQRFDLRVEKLREGGLRLPPTYDVVDFSDDENLKELRERPVFADIKPSAKYADIQLPYSLGLIPAPIAQWLRDYQVEGVDFLHQLFVYQKGGILGDDMGLGKTIQVIAFLTAAYGKTGDERDGKRMRKMRREAERTGKQIWYPRTLIICPGTLIENWKNEFRRWGWWHVEVYHGNAAGRDAALQAAKSGRAEVLITTYSTYRLNKSSVNLVRWDSVIADECHMFKERKSDTAKAMNDVNALCRIGLTGTAIQNKYEELWTLLNWTNPGKLGPISTWKQSVCEPLKIGQSHSATEYQLGLARKTAKKLVENLLPQFFLRRMKTLIKDQLPTKSDRVVFCPLTDTQADAYENFIESDVVQYIKYSAEPCDCNSGKKRGWCCYTHLGSRGKWQNYVFPAIFNLQRLSNHLASLIPQGIDAKDKQQKDLEILEIALPDSWRELYRDRDNILHYANPEFCGKWRILRKLLKFWNDKGDKVLIFSHSVRLLKMLQMLFSHTSYTVSYLDGAMSYEDRAKTVDDFNADPSQFVFLISTRAGGVGLNITSANKVVVFDPNWNPSYDLQAQDRAYRIGQTRDVEVFRLVSAGTIEEIVYARQIYKQQQANIGYNASNERRYFQGVQEKKDQKGEIFGLTNLFEYQNNNVVLRDIVNKTNIAESRAGVNVMDLDFEEDAQVDEADDTADSNSASQGNSEDSQEAAMSQLAAMITSQESPKTKKTSRKAGKTVFPGDGEKSKKHDPVQAILASAGVQYTHENSEVIGSSKVEARLSRRAERADPTAGTDMDAQVFVPESQSFADAPSSRNVPGEGINKGSMKYRYRPPDLVKKRQFCTMAKWAGEKDAVAFAAKVEGWTQAERRECLENFYTWRMQVLEGKMVDKTKDDHTGELQEPIVHNDAIQERKNSPPEIEGSRNKETAALDACETTDDDDDDEL